MVNECFILNNANLAAIFSEGIAQDYRRLKDALPAWALFYAVAGYGSLPEERVSSEIKNITEITRRMGVKPAKTVGGISADEILKAVQRPSEEPYWKLRQTGACQDLLFLTLYKKLGDRVRVMNGLAERCGMPPPNGRLHSAGGSGYRLSL